MTKPHDFKGVYTALITPMHEDGSIDRESLARLVWHLQAQGIKGFYVGGSTGEGFILSTKERQEVLETVVRAAEGKSTIIAHIGSIGTEASIALARHAERQGVDAMSAVVPFYYKTTVEQIKEHYNAIMAAVPLPMLIYHYPGATGVQLSMDFYEEMARHSQCIGVKFTSLNLFEMQQIRARCGDRFLIFNGHDEVYAAGALTGADGAIGSTYNMMAPLFIRMFQEAERGGWSKLPALQAEGNEVIAHMAQFDVIPYEKYICYAQGIIRSPRARQPLKQLTDVETAVIRTFYEKTVVLKASAYQG
ncbi:dihydrodipicolinate synthase family protein [Paenibacillus lutimineralis]|uniref:N-acetylneuraminate lyase n=1 Tax=Paenibacillus lutimineralis TaxID=2707005 RepID=A0A3Q9ICP4_9BACL|nr:dihydrodipicolinate synthase family protein [Paenibacillus lutimineralis]AZS17903.1 N-acetylneuraminate lyase [Paenibacillus lutimineralis]